MPFTKGHPGGPGRPRKADQHAGAIARAEKQIRDRLPELIAAQFDLALGVTVEEVDRESGATVVYRKPPDAKAGQYLIDRIMGKPTERQEVSGADGGPIGITFYSYDALAAEIADGST